MCVSKIRDLCRLCMNADTFMYDIFTVSEDNHTCSLSSKILKCLSIEVKDNSEFPTKVCACCLKSLNAYTEFWEQCHQTDKKLHNLIGYYNKSTSFEATLESYSGYDELYKSPEHSLLFADDEDPTPSESSVHFAELQSSKTVNENSRHDSGELSEDTNNYDISEIRLFESDIDASVDAEGSSKYELQEVGEINEGRNSVEVQVSLNGNSYIVEVLEQSNEKNTNNTEKVKHETEMTSHMAVSDSKISYQCPHCKDSFENSTDLKTHVKEHGDAKSFMCKFCSKWFSLKSGLARHERIHSGEKPYKCVHCTRSFTQNEVLRRHLHTHSGDKPFKCESCGKSYTQKESLRMHVKNNHLPKKLVQITLYKCSLCEKSFCHPSGLSRHQQSHAGRKYPCKNCDKVFTDRSCLTRHTRRVHLPGNSADSVGKGSSNPVQQGGRVGEVAS